MTYQRSILSPITASAVLRGAIAVPKAVSASSGQSAAHAGESYLQNTAFPAWISLFGPRPNFQLSTRRQDRKWFEWTDEGRHHGLAAFAVDVDGLVSKEPIKAIPRRKPWVSSRQWGRV
jgi:hypothetical protein